MTLDRGSAGQFSDVTDERLAELYQGLVIEFGNRSDELNALQRQVAEQQRLLAFKVEMIASVAAELSARRVTVLSPRAL